MPERHHLLRGHPIYWDEDTDEWRYVDSGERTVDGWEHRECGHCGLPTTPEGHDGCLGTLPGVMNACCGHGEPETSYVQFANGVTLRGFRVDAESIDRGTTLRVPESERSERGD